MKTFNCILTLIFFGANFFAPLTQAQELKEKTVFQVAQPWKPSIDVRADVAIIYGVEGNPSEKGKKMPFEERVKSWRDRGYKTHFMTGIAWGEYQDYFTGQWDGINHLSEGQVTMKGDTIWHGRLVPYIVPTASFIQYLKEKHIRRVIDAGIDAIYLEEPEFWMRAGYSDAFKKEWKKRYRFPWKAQHESPENTYLANKLKYELYYNALDEVFTYAKEYGKTKGLNVRCYVPTHSLVNYSSWQIVSPEASLASLSCVDGYVAQVWTGTSREETYYNGLEKERVFENAFLEYGSMESMTRPTGRKMFFLTDPIEDNAGKDWEDYKKNYQATFVAQLLYPMISDYEVMPWPDRIYEGLYRAGANGSERTKIPRFYSTQMQVMINALNDIPRSDNKVSGTSGIAVMMSNSLMFQRFPTHVGYEDPGFSNFYGQTLPLLKRGIPVETTHMENTAYAGTWENMKVLVLSYSNMKPLEPEYHDHIADWVRNGGVLVYCGKDIDPYQSVMEWWNTDGNHYPVPSGHLFEKMGIPMNSGKGEYPCGKGMVYIVREEPKDFVLEADNDKEYFSVIEKAYQYASEGKTPEVKNHFYLERGAYIIASVVDEGASDKPLKLNGLFIDLFNPELPVLKTKTIRPDEQAFLYDLNKIEDRTQPKVLCGASRIYDEVSKEHFYTFVTKSPENTNNASRIYLPGKPKEILIKDHSGNDIKGSSYQWDSKSKTCLVKFENSPEGVSVQIFW
ncbi:MAG: hypothetical protein LBJ72_09210 [Dysgonamonadaceae bacterium]|jgi:hypothetical protein|nr:hypothetical protein [Dysgonamonadaceae bacterium]